MASKKKEVQTVSKTDETGSPSTKRSSYARAVHGAGDIGEKNRLQVVVHSDILDRFDGLAVTHEVWSDKPNPRYITEALLDPAVRDRVCQFFVKRDFGAVFKDLLPGNTRTVQLSDCMFTKTDIHAKLSVGRTPKEAGVLMELILPLFLEFGAVNGNMKYSKHMRYGFNRVTVKDIINEVSTFQVLQAVKTAKGTAIDKSTKYSVSSLAELLAEALRPIGLALLEYADLSKIVDDMVSGVRAHIDPTLSAGDLKGNVPADWRNSAVVEELAQNMVFIRAALAIPPGSDISPISEGWKLNQWGDVILANIKSSERYAWVGKAEVLRSYSLAHVRNGRGKVEAAILARNAKVQPVAQAVFAFPDAMLTGSYNISPTKDRIADAVQSAYGTADFGVAEGATMLGAILSDGIEAGWTGNDGLYVLDTCDAETDVVSIAALLSTRLHVYVDEKGSVMGYDSRVSKGPNKPLNLGDDDYLKVWQPMWWFTVPTRELNLDILSGTHNRSEVVTSDHVEVYLAHDSFAALDYVPPRPQVLGPAAFNTRVVAFDTDILQGVDERYSFDLTINDVKMRGAFKPIGFASLRSGIHTSLVKPHYNEAVIYGAAAAYTAAQYVLEEMTNPESWVRGEAPGEEFFTFMRRRVAGHLLALAQRLSPAFRNEVHEAVIDRSLAQANLSPDEAVVMRATLAQRTFSAAADMIALDFFLNMQGMEVAVWREMMSEPEMIRVWMEVGSDRENRINV